MTKKATFSAGCFWGVESVFRAVPGVEDVVVGYSGGTTENPTYEEVCGGNTGHAEAVSITYDPERVSYERLLEIFWQNHDPTTKDRQGADIGRQYRSVVFYETEDERRTALRLRDELEAKGAFPGPIVTEIVPAGPFYAAEAYHQRYYEKRGIAPSCRI